MEQSINIDEFYNEMTRSVRGRVIKDENLKNHTYFKIGGPAKLFAEPEDTLDLKEVIKLVNKYKINYFVIGNGTNLLVSDDGFDGLIIKIGSLFNGVTIEGELVVVSAGVLLSTLSKKVANQSLAGLEFASGIPGYLGGAVAMNAGAYGGEMKDIVHSVKCMNMNGDILEYSNEEMNFRYRGSKVTDDNLIVLEAKLKLNHGNKEEIFEIMKDLDQKRTSKQPLNLPSAGSTFKRPKEGFAAKLIEDAGLKGLAYGGAMVSDKHCGFIVSYKNASCQEVLELMRIVQSTVFDKFNIELEPEVKILGTQL